MSRARAILTLGALAALAVGGAALAAAPSGLRVSATLRPGHVHLGEPTVYSGMVIVPPGSRVRWGIPSSDSLWSWGPPHAWQRAGEAGGPGRGSAVAETAHVEITAQAFTTGALPVRGLPFEIVAPDGARRLGRLPLLQLGVLPMIAANDTSAQLRPLHGPLAAPWWERVPWRWVALAVAALALLLLLVRWLRRRAARSAAGPEAAPLLDPVQRALAELTALRGLALPEQSRFGEHAFHLTRIARGFLESVSGVTRPGDTTPGLIARLEGAQLADADRTTLAGLFRSWDLLKFARAHSSVAEARAAESALESLVRRWDEARRSAASQVA